MSEPLLLWDSVLAGRYVNQRLTKTVCHAVVQRDFKVGRIARRQWETLCKRIDPDQMTGAWTEPTSQCPPCPRCMELAKKIAPLWAQKYSTQESEAKTWVDERGYETGTCVDCGMDASAHPDAGYTLNFCGDCGAVVCGQCHDGTQATRCRACAQKQVA